MPNRKSDKQKTINELIEESMRLAKQSLERAEKDRLKAEEHLRQTNEFIERVEKERKEMEEFAKRRFYENHFDYYYRVKVRKVPSQYLDLPARVYCHYSEEDLVEMIEYARREDIKELANNIMVEYSQKETINADDLKFSVRFGKKYKWTRRRICLDDEHDEHINNIWHRNKEN